MPLINAPEWSPGISHLWLLNLFNVKFPHTEEETPHSTTAAAASLERRWSSIEEGKQRRWR